MTWPTLTFSPCLTRMSFTTPVTEEGTSTTALSVSSSITGWPSETFAPGEIIRRTRSPLIDVFAEFGELEFGGSWRRQWRDAQVRVRPRLALVQEPVSALAGGDATACFAGEGVCRQAPAPLSTVKITWPTLTFCPSLTRISFTVPVIDEGTSTTALSVSSSITGWPSVMVAPGEIIRRTSSPWSMFSPSSGSLNSVNACSLHSPQRLRRHYKIDPYGTPEGVP